MFEVKLPKIRDEADESLIVIWLVSEGEEVGKGDPLLEIQTEKEVTEIEAEVSGIIQEIRVKRGDTAKVGEVLATIAPSEGSGEEHVPEEQQLVEQEGQDNDKPELEKPEELKMVEKGENQQQAGTTPQQKEALRVTPGMRKLAKELGVQLENVKGSGRNGKITETDIRQAATEGDQTEEAIPLSGIRGTIAKRMMESLHTSAQLTETAWADVTELKKRKEQQADAVGWTSISAKAVALALTENPLLNAHIEGNQILPRTDINLGFAIDTPDGLQVAVVHDCDKLAPEELEKQLKELAERARNKQLVKKDTSGGTFTLTSLGAHRIQFFTPIINPPEVAILGLGKIEPYLVMQDGEVVERYRLPLSLTFDHRAIDGAPAASFLSDLINLLEEPQHLL
ncbi:dihydrolipoamide acetyltransferase family protein [Planococcus salinus]|uniref:Dihydrolipoamide acetyltransferase component of pyruvate dehydrogenase complex n=1 Tax=Planococcus salinus TaxID=1848460 RepID=A0A3M8P6I7_9BACL|nr:dihydrolipoamide acetyltransferase family protein [Planococcus salinus]RNF39011.1 2-oxo acid dehydrogenase subunit E2 [Planococcus salinus]